jgi:hypothetical protein
MEKIKAWISTVVQITDDVISSVVVRSALLYTGWEDQLSHANARFGSTNSEVLRSRQS